MPKYIIKTHNKIISHSKGLKKEESENKACYDLIPYEPMERLAMHFTNGAKKYGEYNWQKAATTEEINLFKRAALRHIQKWSHNIQDGEDHASAAITNLMMYEWLIINKK